MFAFRFDWSSKWSGDLNDFVSKFPRIKFSMFHREYLELNIEKKESGTEGMGAVLYANGAYTAVFPNGVLKGIHYA